MRKLAHDPFLGRLLAALMLYAAMVTVWMHSARPPPALSRWREASDDARPAPQSTAERWQQSAEDDYRLCREFARRHGARLARTLRSQRVGWDLFGHTHCALLLPDSRLDVHADDEWYLYYVSGESLFRRSAAQRAQMGMIVLAESGDDWAALLRQALRETVFDVRYDVTPDYVNALGETELVGSGFVFTVEAYAPGAACPSSCRVTGAGATPEDAARDACRRWLQDQGAAASV